MGISLTAIRLPAMLAAAGVALMVFAFVKRQTRSNRWGGIGVGLFAAAYRVMDCYLDVGHRDSLLALASALSWLHRPAAAACLSTADHPLERPQTHPQTRLPRPRQRHHHEPPSEPYCACHGAPRSASAPATTSKCSS